MEGNESVAAELRREYQREWRKKNKDKVAKYNREYWIKKAKELEEEKHDDKKQHKKSLVRSWRLHKANDDDDVWTIYNTL